MTTDKNILAPKARLTETEKLNRAKESVFYDYEKKSKVKVIKKISTNMAFFDRLSESNDGSVHFESCYQLAKEYAEKNNLVFDSRPFYEGGHYFLETVTGSDVSSYREASEALAKVLAQMGIDIVVVYALERLGRTATHLQIYFSIFEKYGIKLIILNGQMDNVDFKNPMSKMMLAFMSFMAEMEAHNISTRVKRSVQHNAKLGFDQGGVAPFGMVKQEVKTAVREKPFQILVPDETIVPQLGISKADLIRQAAQKYADGSSFTTIAKWFNDLGIPTYNTLLLEKKKAKLGLDVEIAKLHWVGRSVSNIILNPKLAGYRTIGESSKFAEKTIDPEIFIDSNGNELRTYVPVYSDELWEAVKKRKKTSVAYKQKGNMSLLRGLVFCSSCGGRLQCSGNKFGRSYACINYNNGKCVSNNIKVDGVEDIVKAVFTTLVEDKEVQTQYMNSLVAKDKSNKIKEVSDMNNKLIGDLNARLVNIQEMYKEGVYHGSIQDFKSEVAKIELDIERYSKPIEKVEVDKNPFKLIENLTADEIYNTLDIKDLNIILHEFIGKVMVTPNSKMANPINSRRLSANGLKCDPARVQVVLKVA